jgi:hypothetical protein
MSYVRYKEGSIASIWKRYDIAVGKMEELHKRKRTPQGAKVPLRISKDEIWSLDIDSNIWNDTTLDYMVHGTTEDNDLPEWMTNQEVKDGICAMLDIDRCLEEEQQLKWDREALQLFSQEQWLCINAVIQATPQDDVEHHSLLNHKKAELLDVIVQWEAEAHSILADMNLSGSWGPTPEEMLDGYRIYTDGSLKVGRDMNKWMGNEEEDEDEEERDEEEEEDAYSGINYLWDTLPNE